MVSQKFSPPLVTPAGGDTKRQALLGALAFIEGTQSGWGLWELSGWFEEHLVAAGRMSRVPRTVQDPTVGSIALEPISSPGQQHARFEDAPKLIATARSRVVGSLLAFAMAGKDDRFLNAAIYAGRVRRSDVDGRTTWVASPGEGDALSDIVLSLFTVDILSEREFYEKNLCVCEMCGKVSFQPSATGRTGCREHPSRASWDSASSGFMRKASEDGDAGAEDDGPEAE